jgi:Zn-dependent protease with chaperone function
VRRNDRAGSAPCLHQVVTERKDAIPGTKRDIKADLPNFSADRRMACRVERRVKRRIHGYRDSAELDPRRLDSHELNACIIGDTLILNRSLFDSQYLEAVLAHELGHLNSMDARVTVAVNRLPTAARATTNLRHNQTTAFKTGHSLGLPVNLVILIIRGCAGGLAADAMTPAWSAWWRLREYIADTYAIRLGQGEQLATFLEDHALLYDIPIKRIWTSDQGHPSVALRIERIRGGA